MSQTVPVLIVGGGPVGLALAADLGWRGVECLVVEQGDGKIIDAKMFATGIRTVEFCRRWGIAGKVRNWGFPRDFPFDNVFVTSLTGYELGRIPRPTLDQTPKHSTSPEDYAHCPQFIFDPILAELARGFPAVTLRYGCELTGFRDTGEHIEADLSDKATGRTERIRAAYLVGCDGYHSRVREALGIEMRGRPFLNRSINVMFRTRDLSGLHDKGNAGRYVLIGPQGSWASLVPADGRQLWRLMLHGSDDFDVSAAEARDMIRNAVGRDFEFEILTIGHWVRRMMVADHYARGRVFLAGDAVHVMPPNGGLGMNTGIGDAVDLSWKLAATHAGWGGGGLLESYEAERRPAGLRACNEALRNLERYRSDVRHPTLLEDSAEGAKMRTDLGQRLATANRAAWEAPDHTHLGYTYENSPICAPDGSRAPAEPDDPRVYVQTSRPGGRAPHAWLDDGRSTLDLFGRGFTLLRLGQDAPDGGPIVAAAARRGVPLDVHAVSEPDVGRLYERKIVLVRPDGHVAWRSDTLPTDPLALVDRVRGAAADGRARPAL
jgi:2-polyprenyl-6-methoxyphenol hydroxylase-like FAD-dependent oxidoreductase